MDHLEHLIKRKLRLQQALNDLHDLLPGHAAVPLAIANITKEDQRIGAELDRWSTPVCA